MGDRPARRVGTHAEARLQRKIVHLVDDAVDVIGKIGPAFLDGVIVFQQRFKRVKALHQRIGPETPFGQQRHHFHLAAARHDAHLAPGIGEKPQRALGSDSTVELAQGTRRRIARIDVKRLSLRFQFGIERLKGLLGHVDLAAHFHDVGDIFPRQNAGYVGNGLRIGGDVLANHPVTARCRTHQPSVLIAQRQRQPVDLRFRRQCRAPVELQEAGNRIPEIGHVFIAERIGQRQHRLGVRNLLELVERHETDPSRR